jgi:hypothetical protein
MAIAKPSGLSLVEALAHLLGDGRERRVGDGYVTLCPAHDDHTPSLSLDVGDTQAVVWCCQVRCSNDAVMRAMIDRGIPPAAVGFKQWPGEPRTGHVIAFERPKKSEPEQKKTEDEWVQAVSAPDDAPVYRKSANAAAIWEYHGLDNRLLGYVERVNRNRGGKDFYPYTLWRNKKTSAMEWRSKAFPTPRPLYGLPRLTERPGVRVLIVAGEKCADSGMRCVPNRVTLSGSGGEKAVTQTDWTPLDGRDVDIWPDHDAPGAEFAVAVKTHLMKLDSNRAVRILRLPDDFPRPNPRPDDQ